MTCKAEVPWQPFFLPKMSFEVFLVDAHDVVGQDGQIGAKIRSVAQLLRVQ